MHVGKISVSLWPPRDVCVWRCSVEFRGHSLLQAARDADLLRVKKHLSADSVNFKHPLTQETPLVRVLLVKTCSDRMNTTSVLSLLQSVCVCVSQHCAVASPYLKRKQVCELLLRKGADVNNRTREWVPPAFLWHQNAPSKDGRHWSTLSLCTNTKPPNPRSEFCYLYPVMSCRDGVFGHLCMQAGCLSLVQCHHVSEPLEMSWWCHCLLSLLTPLHVASEKAHNDVLEVLVKHEAKVSRATTEGCFDDQLIHQLFAHQLLNLAWGCCRHVLTNSKDSKFLNQKMYFNKHHCYLGFCWHKR